MSTAVCGVMVRDREPGMFADLTSSEYTVTRRSGLTTLLFTDDLDDATIRAVRARMLSRGDTDVEGQLMLDHLDVLDDPDAEYDPRAVLRDVLTYLFGCEAGN